MRGNVLAVSYGVLKCTVTEQARYKTPLLLTQHCPWIPSFLQFLCSLICGCSFLLPLFLFISFVLLFLYFPLLCFSYILFISCVCISLLSTWKLSMGYIFHIFVPVFLVNVSWLLFLSVAMSVLSGYVHFTVTRSVFVVNVWGVVTCCNVHIKLKWTPCYSVSIWLKCPSFCCDVMSRRNVHLL